MVLFTKQPMVFGLVRKFSEYAKKMPSPQGLPLIGTALDLISCGPTKLHLYIDSRHRELGPVFRENIGVGSSIFICDPQEMRRIFTLEGKHPNHFLPESWLLYNKIHDCKRGLFFMDGQEWLQYRRVMNKFLLKNDICNELETVYSTTVNNLIDKFNEYSGKEMDNLTHELYKHSVSFVLATLMGTSYLKEYENFVSDIDQLAYIFRQIFETTCKLNLLPVKLVATLKLPPWKRFETSVNSSLIASKEIMKRIKDKCSADGLLKKLLNEGIPMEIVESIVVDLMLAAGDTTAYSTAWALYLLSKEKDQGDFESKGVVKEALRLYPPAAFITRRLPAPATIAGYHVPQGELLLLSMYTAGRSEVNFPQPEKFWPGRWGRTGVGYVGVNKISAFLPFALGARSCVGRKIAEYQMNSTISRILSNFHLELIEEVEMELRMVPVPSKPIRIKVLPRQKKE